MSDPLVIPRDGARCVWVFTVDLPEADVFAMSEEELGEAFGLWTPVFRGDTECFQAQTLAEYGFANYLSEANGFTVPSEDVAKLDALDGTVFLLFSNALDVEKPYAVLAPELPFSFVGRYDDAATLPSMTPLTSEAAEGLLPQGDPKAKPIKSDARMSGMVATLVLIFLAIFVVAFVMVGA